MRLYVVAGEVSGDLHASNLMHALRHKNSQISFRGIGGEKMMEQGLDAYYHIRQLNYMGLAEVLKNIFTIRKILQQVKEDILAYKPDALVLVDYPGFNLQLARFAKSKGIRCIYYISPKIWAWRSSRANIIRQHVDLMLSILPFEKEFYKKYGYNITYVGNPVMDAINNYSYDNTFIEKYASSEKPIVALLPGSRKQEILQCLPVMLEAASLLPDYRFVIAGLDFTKDWIAQANHAKVEVVYNKTYDVLKCSKAALVTSGTATLETALLQVPQVCCYKTSALTYFAARNLIQVPYISLVNLINNEPTIKELIQQDFNVENLKAELNKLMNDETYRKQLSAGYAKLLEKLGPVGASERAAKAILKFL